MKKVKWLMLFLIIVIILVLGCIDNSNAIIEGKLILSEKGLDIIRFHDDEKNVTCWVTIAQNVKWQSSGGGISCLTDAQISVQTR